MLKIWFAFKRYVITDQISFLFLILDLVNRLEVLSIVSCLVSAFDKKKIWP